jgi:amino acid permease
MDRSQQNSTLDTDKKSASNQDIGNTHEDFTTQVRPMATIQDDDERLLARIGYKQELRREFTKWSTVSYAISILGVLGSQPATYGVPLSLGGPATAIWAWFIGSIMAFVIASSGSLIVEP